MLKSISGFSKRFSDKITNDAVTAYSGEAALYIIISLFPFLMFLMTLMRYLPFSQEEFLEVVSRFLPSIVNSTLDELVDELFTTSGTLISITIIATLWTASRGILTIYRGLNSIYGIKETRNYFYLRLRSMLYTFAFSIMLIMILALYVFGDLIKRKLVEAFPWLLQNQLALLVMSFRTAIGAVVLMVLFVVMYNCMPNRKAKIRAQLPGSVVASVGWVGFSYLFSIYIDHMDRIKTSYGSLTAVVLCIIWLYFCMMIFFFGAEVNSVFASEEFQKILRRLLRKKPAEPETPNVSQQIETVPDMPDLLTAADIPATSESSVLPAAGSIPMPSGSSGLPVTGETEMSPVSDLPSDETAESSAQTES